MDTYIKLTEAEIAERVVRGEKLLYEIIVRRFNPYLYKVGRSFNYNHEDTQDLMQETFIDAYKNLAQFERRSVFKTWIIRIMLNNCFRKKRKYSFKNEIMQDIPERSQPVFQQPASDPQHIVQNHELEHIIEEALGKIPEDYRMVFSLREINGLNVSETADLLNISETNVKVRLNRSKAMLRKEIENSYSVSELFEFNAVYCDSMAGRVMRVLDGLEFS